MPDNKANQALALAASLEEKRPTVSVPAMDAFGIPIVSRWGKAAEMVDMLEFCICAANKGVAHLVTGLRYESAQCYCEVEVVDSVTPGSKEGEVLRQCAEMSLVQYILFGFSGYGRELAGMTDEPTNMAVELPKQASVTVPKGFALVKLEHVPNRCYTCAHEEKSRTDSDSPCKACCGWIAGVKPVCWQPKNYTGQQPVSTAPQGADLVRIPRSRLH